MKIYIWMCECLPSQSHKKIHFFYSRFSHVHTHICNRILLRAYKCYANVCIFFFLFILCSPFSGTWHECVCGCVYVCASLHCAHNQNTLFSKVFSKLKYVYDVQLSLFIFTVKWLWPKKWVNKCVCVPSAYEHSFW